MKVGIVVAMPQEFEAVNFALNNYKISQSLVHSLPLSIFAYKNLNIYGIISKIGKVASSVATAILIKDYKCDVIINVGLCGGLNNAQIGDIIITNKSAYGDVDLTAFNYPKGQISGQPHIFESSTNIINFQTFLNTLNDATIPTCLIVSSDSFINSPTKISEINGMYSDIIGVDMEAGAIGQVCHLFATDVLYLKKVSDKADNGAEQSFKGSLSVVEDKIPAYLIHLLEYLNKI